MWIYTHVNSGVCYIINENKKTKTKVYYEEMLKSYLFVQVVVMLTFENDVRVGNFSASPSIDKELKKNRSF